MAGHQKAKSEETRRRILTAAAELMKEGGLKSLQIREVSTRANCATGSVYKYFSDLDELIIAVNSLTLGKIRQTMSAAAEETDPVVRLKHLAHAYLVFAEENKNEWRGLFDHHLPDGADTPEAHRQENVALLSLIAEPLRTLDPGLDDRALAIRTRTCFGAMHGLVTIALEGRFVGLGEEDLKSEMEFVVEQLCRA